MAYEVYDANGSQVQRGAGVAVSKEKHGTFVGLKTDDSGNHTVVIERGAQAWRDAPEDWGFTIKEVPDPEPEADDASTD